MTKTEFIDAYGHGKYKEHRVKGGYDIGTRSLRAFTCSCEEDICHGWQMVNTTELLPDVVEIYGYDLSTMNEE